MKSAGIDKIRTLFRNYEKVISTIMKNMLHLLRNWKHTVNYLKHLWQ